MLKALLEKMEKEREAKQLSRRARLSRVVCHQNAWEKLLKYYNLIDRSHSIYTMALLLHPQYHKHYFDSH